MAHRHHATRPAGTASSSPTTAARTPPAVLPSGVSVDSDPCSERLAGGTFTDLTVRFLDEQPGTATRGCAATAGSTWPPRTARAPRWALVRADTTYDVGTVATTETGGAPLEYAVATGPIRVAGTPYLTGTLTALGVNNRVLRPRGRDLPADAHLVQNNVPRSAPLRRSSASTAGRPAVRRRRRPGRADALRPAEPGERHLRRHGQPDSGSRGPEDTAVHLPVVGRVSDLALQRCVPA